MATMKRAAKSGPRGGTTTRSRSGLLIKKAFWVHPDEDEALRREAYETRRSEADIVREALRQRYQLGELADET